ncbi:MAG: 50S ribosomal protein L4 [SAR324 cluster bacterium]|uniref:Large ribosomal subunit protein uL4 n=1 Tax=SAR324 cluster bacterium TaxID=2024889 RepID=A0A7X9FP20_9DELT|nr:50S ribosomal protein L4 [SAR324 cluster bacterium]
MATIDVFDLNKNKIESIDLSSEVFAAEIKEHLVHEAIRMQQMNKRSGTVSVKNRSEVSGSGKKPFKQKGTGQARQGCSRAPQYPGGGVVFGPQPKVYNLSMNKKAYKSAMRSALTSLKNENRITIVNKLELNTISTKNVVKFLNTFAFTKTLIVCDNKNKEFLLSARNVKNVKVVMSDNLNVYDLVNFKNIVFSQAAVKQIEGVLQP